MREAAPTDPNEDSFADLLRQGVKKLREERGTCPSSKDLVAFHEGRLPAEQTALLQNHVDACGLCDAQLGRLERANESGWRPLSTAIRNAVRKPIVPYALAALLLYPAYRGFFRPARERANVLVPGTAPHVQTALGVSTIRSFSLDGVRSGSNVQNAALIRLSGDESFFLLSFLVPMKASPPNHYEVMVARGDGTDIAPAQPLTNCDAVGNCSLICNPAVFPLGAYEVRVTETTPDGSKAITFPFQIAR
jgi:hypothetical protein